MFFVIFLILLLSPIPFILVKRAKEIARGVNYSSYHGPADPLDAVYFLIAVSGILLIVCIIVQFAALSNQNSDKNAIKQFQANQAIYQNKTQTLTAELKSYLAVQYPKMEERIFDKIASNPTALLTVYPQLQSSTTIVKLTDQIVSLQNKVYEQQTNITEKQKDINTRRGNPFYLTFLF